MRLSMWILADWLKDYKPQLKIQEGKRTLRNVRLYAEEQRMESSSVYVGKAQDFIDVKHDQIICAHQHDMLILDAEDINQVLNEILDAFEYYNNWSDTINERLKTEYSLQDMLTDSEAVFNRTMLLADSSYYVYAQRGLEGQASEYPDFAAIIKEHITTLDAILSINQDKRIRINNPYTYILEQPKSGLRNAVRNLFFRGQHRGWLVTTRIGGEVTRGEMDVQDELGDIVERWMEIHQGQQELLEKSCVFQQILNGSCLRGEDVYRRIESLNWRRNDIKQVYVLRQDEGNIIATEALDRKLEQFGSVFAVHYEDNLLLIVNCSLVDEPMFEKDLCHLLEKASCYCGKSPQFTDIFKLKTSYEQALIAADYGRDHTNRIRDFENAALPYCFTLIVRNEPVSPAHPALKCLRSYDEKHHTQLYLTLETYLQAERSYVKTAAALFIHRNSLLYRIERISELTGLDLESPDLRLHLLMSYQIERYRNVNNESIPIMPG